jgi:pilus assembly protein CpaE
MVISMRSLKVAILAPDLDQPDLQSQVESTGMARAVYSSAALPRSVQEPAYVQLCDSKPDVILIDIPLDAQAALACIEFLHGEMPEALLVPLGDATRPQMIVSAMRAGAGEFLERPINTGHLQQALGRHLKQSACRNGDGRGKLFCFVNAKGGSGATTAAVNTALALAAKDQQVALVEMGTPGGATLQLNVTPRFTLADAFRSFSRLDSTLLEGMMMDCGSGLHLLAASEDPVAAPNSEQVARFMDLLAAQYRYVVIDASSRLDELTRVICEFSDSILMVAQPDMGSLWSAAKVRRYIAGTANDQRIGLLLNRYRRLPGLESPEIEEAVGCRIAWTIPNQYISVTRSIENGTPVARDEKSEMARAFTGLAALLKGDHAVVAKQEQKRGRGSVFERLTGARAFSFGNAGR